MAGDRQPRKRNRNDPSGIENKGKRAEPDGHDPERDPGRTLDGIGRGSSRDRMGSEQFRPQQDIGGHGEQDYRDVGRGQPGGAYEHSGGRDYRHGSGYGGFGESPGESGGGTISTCDGTLPRCSACTRPPRRQSYSCPP